MKPDELVLRFLNSIGRPAEARVYLDQFRSAQPEAFAMIAVDQTVVAQTVGALVTDVGFLAHLGLTPVVVIDSQDAARVLHQRLSPTVACRLADPGTAADVCRAGGIPVVTVSGDAELTAMAIALGARKLVFLGRRSGLSPAGQRVASLIDVTTEFEALCAPGVLPSGQRALLARIREILRIVPHRMTVSVTSALDLLRELFTERGAGTLVRVGSKVARHDSIDGLDRAALEGLVNAAFGRTLAPGYFDRPFVAIYTADEYRGAAVLEASALAPYLSKFAVGLAARGEGVGGDLFRAMAAEHPRLFWRSRHDNPIAGWYTKRADGLQRVGAWTVFWRGLAVEEIPAAIAHASAAPVDFAEG